MATWHLSVRQLSHSVIFHPTLLPSVARSVNLHSFCHGESIPQFAVGAKKLFMEDATLAALTDGNIIIISAIYIFFIINFVVDFLDLITCRMVSEVTVLWASIIHGWMNLES